MQLHYLAQHLLELIQTLEQWNNSASFILTKYFNQHSNLGSNQRHILSQACYTWLRCKNSWQQAVQQLIKSDSISQWSYNQVLTYSLLQRVAPNFINQPANLVELANLVNSQQQSIGLAKADFELPIWLKNQLLQQLGEQELLQLVLSLQPTSHLDLRVNSLKSKLEKLIKQIPTELQASPMSYSPIGIRLQTKTQLSQLDIYQQGLIEVQNEGSQLIALLAAPKKEQIVIDYCAGAGGKTLALGGMMRNSGRLYAFDNSASRLQALQPRLQRSGLTNVYTRLIDNPNSSFFRQLQAKADVVLVDAPCSGLGTLRRAPELKWRYQPQDITNIAQQQQQILANAARLVKPGGRLVYATCSILEQENQQQAQQFSQQHKNFMPVNVLTMLQQQKVTNATELISNIGDTQYLSLWPQRHGSDGFFAAVWQRNN